MHIIVAGSTRQRSRSIEDDNEGHDNDAERDTDEEDRPRRTPANDNGQSHVDEADRVVPPLERQK